MPTLQALVIFNRKIFFKTKNIISVDEVSLSFGAADEIRTRDIQLGRLTLYQLSYHRECLKRKL